MIRYGLDGMGGDNAPQATVKGAVEALKRIGPEDTIYIFGTAEDLEAELSKYTYNKDRLVVVPTTEVISNHDAPVKAVRRKKDSSMVVGLNYVNEGKIDVFVSAGSTGALMSGSLLIIGRIRGIDRPALASVLPPMAGKKAMLLIDSGANTDCKPNNYLEFGVMGSIYMSKVMNIESPTVGLVNIGSEETKGNTASKEAYSLMNDARVLNFKGNVEAREIPDSPCDVLVCDGFVGNVILKYTEGLGMAFMRILKEKLSDGLSTKIGAALVKDKLRSFKDMFDYSEYGGAPFLGVKGAVIKMHGSSDYVSVMNTILKAGLYVENKVVDTIHDEILKLAEEAEEAETAEAAEE